MSESETGGSDITLTADEQRLVESLKLEFEWHKHLTTLISGIVLALVTVLQAFFVVGKGDQPYSNPEVVALEFCFGALALGLVSSILSMSNTIRMTRSGQEPGRFSQFVSTAYPLVALIGGLLGFVGFAASRTGLIEWAPWVYQVLESV